MRTTLFILSLTVVLDGAATPAVAGGCDLCGHQSDFDCAIKVVPAPAASAAHDFQMVIRDAGNNPIVDAEIVIDFSGCGGDVRVALQQPNDLIVGCPSQTITARTGAGGAAALRIVGGGSGGDAFATGPCATITVDGVPYGTFQVALFDYDGVNGLTSADLSSFLTDFFTTPVPPAYSARSDYNFVEGGCISQELTATDFSRWLDAFFIPGGTYETPLCP